MSSLGQQKMIPRLRTLHLITKKGEDLKCDPKAQKEVEMKIMKFPGHPPASYTFLVQSLADCP